MIYVKQATEVPVGTLIKFTSAVKTTMVDGVRTKLPHRDRLGIVIQQTEAFITVKDFKTGENLGLDEKYFRIWQVRRFK